MSAGTLWVLFNHTLTPDQEWDARRALEVDHFEMPPESVSALWRQIPPELETLSRYLAPVRKWLKSSAAPGDVVLIQGDFGACWLMVAAAFEFGLVPVYSTTRREALETVEADGHLKITHRFRHVAFRSYGR